MSQYLDEGGRGIRMRVGDWPLFLLTIFWPQNTLRADRRVSHLYAPKRKGLSVMSMESGSRRRVESPGSPQDTAGARPANELGLASRRYGMEFTGELRLRGQQGTATDPDSVSEDPLVPARRPGGKPPSADRSNVEPLVPARRPGGKPPTVVVPEVE